ncbi:MAG: EamA family transporter [Flavobacteriales bacterium]|jgi:drug/metabolite transporter (DMT)-like permease|nr:EamA family transporter [Flavobacteriales bacterium]|tara:strand:- start:13219 stop:14115 length:897 start_codon:yes stop_codon:yes gene_type:complete
MSDIFKSHAALFIANLIYALTFTVAKDVMPETIKPLGFILVRVTGAMILFQLIHRIWIREKVEPRDYGVLLLCGLFGVAINMMLFFKGLNFTTPIHASVTMTSTPIMVFILAIFFHGEKIIALRIIGIILGAIGAIILALYGQKLEVNNPNLALGNILVFVNACSYALYLTLIKPLMRRYHFITLLKWVFSIGFFVVLPFGYYEVQEVDWLSISPKIYIEIVFVVVFTSFLAYMLNVYALKRLRASTVGFYIYLQPVLATFIALSVGSDKMDVVKIFAAIFIFVGVYLVGRKPKAVRD